MIPGDRARPRQGAYHPRVRTVVCVVAGLLALGAVAIVVVPQGAVLPEGLQGWARRNSEAWWTAVLMLTDLWWVPTRFRSRLWRVWMAALVIVGAVLLLESARMPGSVATLKESVVAVALVSLWVRLPVRARGDGDGPWPGLWAVLAVLAALIAVGGLLEEGGVVTLVVDHAETIGLGVVLLVLVDVVHPWPGSWRSAAPAVIRLGYAVVLVLVPLVVAVLAPPSDVWGLLRYLSRLTESFLAGLVLLAVAEFGHRAGRAARGGDDAASGTAEFDE